MKQAKAKLPLKTKIAVWWLVTIGVILTIYGIVVLSLAEPGTDGSIYNYVIGIVALVSAFLYIISGILFAIKKRGPWVAALVILALLTLATIVNAPYGVHLNYYFFNLFIADTEGGSAIRSVLMFISILSTLTPLVLVVSDVKNYWSMTEKVETSDEPSDASGE